MPTDAAPERPAWGAIAEAAQRDRLRALGLPPSIVEAVRVDARGHVDFDAFLAAFAQWAHAAADPLWLVVAGHLQLEAWTVLRVETEDALARLHLLQDALAAPEPDPLDDFLASDFARALAPGRAYTDAVLTAAHAPLHESVHHGGARKVTLMDLLGLLEEGLAEARARASAREHAEAARALADAARSRAPATSAHRDELETAAALRVLIQARGRITLRAAARELGEGYGGTLAAALLLRGVVRVRQWDFPRGPVELESA